MRDDDRWRRYWRALVARFRPGADEEIAFHVEMRTRQLIAQGMEPGAAAREAVRRFGDRTRIKSQLERIERKRGRRMRFGYFLQELWQDGRFAFRALMRRPGFAFAAASSLALGIGATTTVISIVDPLLFRRLAVPASDQLVVVGAVSKALNVVTPLVSLPTARDIAARTDLFADAAAVRMQIGAVRRTGDDLGERTLYFATSGSFFSVFQIGPVLGRFFTQEDDRERAPVVVLAHQYWKRAFRGDPAVVGKPLFVNGVPLTIVGIAPPGFQGVEHLVLADFFVPIGTQGLISSRVIGSEECRTCTSYELVGRLQPGRTVADLRGALSLLTRQLAAAVPELGEGYRLVGFAERRARLTISAAPMVGPVGAVFLGLAALVLVAACVNATNLVLARASSRGSEMTLRLALGASRARVARQVLTENVVLALIGLAGGYGVARLALGLLNRVPLPSAFPLGWHFGIDLRIFGLATLVAIGSGLLAGIGPALASSRGQVQHRLKEGSRGAVGRGGGRLRAALVVGQIAASMVVLVFAGLFATSLKRAAAIDPGFRAEPVLKLAFDASLARYDGPTARRAYERIEREVRQLPQVVEAAWSTGVPLSHSVGTVANITPDDPSIQASKTGTVGGWMAAIGPDYFSTMGIPLVEGRPFRIEDDTASRPVVIVNQHVADLLWPGSSAIGRRLRLGPTEPWLEVVGVAKTGRYVLIGESPRSFVYQPFAQAFDPYAFLLVKTRVAPRAAMAAITEAAARADRSLIPGEVEPMTSVLNDGFNGLLPLKLGAGIASAIGLAALALTIVGLYGVIAYSVAERTREIGVRIALGAPPATVVRSVLGQGLTLAGFGIAIGLGLAILATRAAAGLLVGTGSTDGGVLALVTAVLLLVTLGSAFLPARRASRLDPVSALRAD